ncbi:Uncharacterised protein [Streptococcus pyogenes]|uniref:Uncharacterized protein n=2 Tax=Streptococcus TaxID=1301 RepID=A0AAE4TQR8_STRCB|nr:MULTISPECIES: hypothetical protein [Streptococcus]MDV5976083.1 hypothetical protein [Streptococcus canis]VHC58730.1 Uncharacterised protein [Streptococcus pyogenes]VHD04337.1 Uncharacterised protein [Streptococcus pyogenes]VHD22134.1 Uncharacterised protein [Streptococcus pyogenes]
MAKKVTMTISGEMILIEYYGENFPLHPQEWKDYHSFWQEDYVRFHFQTDIGTLTIYDGNYDLTLLWGEPVHRIEKLYHQLLTDPIPVMVYGDERFQEAYRTENGQTKNLYLEHVCNVCKEAYEVLFKQINQKERNT